MIANNVFGENKKDQYQCLWSWCLNPRFLQPYQIRQAVTMKKMASASMMPAMTARQAAWGICAKVEPKQREVQMTKKGQQMMASMLEQMQLIMQQISVRLVRLEATMNRNDNSGGIIAWKMLCMSFRKSTIWKQSTTSFVSRLSNTSLSTVSHLFSAGRRETLIMAMRQMVQVIMMQKTHSQFSVPVWQVMQTRQKRELQRMMSRMEQQRRRRHLLSSAEMRLQERSMMSQLRQMKALAFSLDLNCSGSSFWWETKEKGSKEAELLLAFPAFPLLSCLCAWTMGLKRLGDMQVDISREVLRVLRSGRSSSLRLFSRLLIVRFIMSRGGESINIINQLPTLLHRLE